RKVLDVIGRNNAKHRLINGYGPTETTVYSTYYFINGLKENVVNVPIGRPVPNTTVYIADRNKNLTPPGVAGELFIGGTSLAHGYLNRPELTAEKFTEPGSTWGYLTPRGGDYPTLRGGDYPTPRGGATLSGRVYRTGDLVRWLPDGNIQYLGRIDQQVKIRGFRIEPAEIRSALLKYPTVGDAVVRALEYKSGDKFLCAYIVSQSRETALLKDFLSDYMPDYMVPDHFVYLDAIPLTVNGKVDIKALPAPTMDTSGDEEWQQQTAFSAPRNTWEMSIRETWAEVLKRNENTIGIDDNFFQMGGHSLNAGILLAKIHKKLKLKIPMGEFFKNPTIRGMGRCMEQIPGSLYSSVGRVEKKEYYALSAAQQRLYFLNKLEDIGTGYNMPSVFRTVEPPVNSRLKSVLAQLVSRHEALRTSFIEIEGTAFQRVCENAAVDIEYTRVPKPGTDTDTAPGPSPEENLAAGAVAAFIRPFDLAVAPLLRVGVIELPAGEHLLLLDMHHIIGDGTSMGILARDFARLYHGQPLQPAGVQYKDFASWQNTLLQSEIIESQADYWRSVFPDDELPVLDLPTDFPRPAVFSFAGDRISFETDGATTAGLKKLARNQGATLYMVVMTAFSLLLHKYTGREDIVVGNVIMGRPHADLQDIVGMFVNTLPMRTRPHSAKTCTQLLRETKEQGLAAFENQDIQFEHLVEILEPRRDPSRNPVFDVCLVFQNMELSTEELPLLKPALHLTANKTAKFDMTLTAEESGEAFHFSLEYCTALFRRETIAQMSRHFLTILRYFKEKPSVPVGAIDVLSQKEKQLLLHEYNRTAVAIESRSINEIFSDHVLETPDAIAVAGVPHDAGTNRRSFLEAAVSLTYRQLAAQADQLANRLRAEGVGPDTIVALMFERSPEMIIGILGILKAGGAYLPIDPEAPGERIVYMLNDSTAPLLVTSQSISPAIDHKIKRIFPGHAAGSHYHTGDDIPGEICPPEPGNPERPAYVIYTSGTTGKPKGTLIPHSNVVGFVGAMDYLALKSSDRMLQVADYTFDISVFNIYAALLNGAELVVPEREDFSALDGLAEIAIKKNITAFFMPTGLFNALVEVNVNMFAGVRNILVGGEALSPSHCRKVLDVIGRNNAKHRLINGYGPTETTVYSTYYFINGLKENVVNVPIG
ncbi:MAG: AMP-binding protein, partial [bacterium]|nr:AMP-binding protein [bacterium]